MLWLFGMNPSALPQSAISPVKSEFYIELERIQTTLTDIGRQLDAIAQELQKIAKKLDEIGKQLEELAQTLALDTQGFHNTPDLLTYNPKIYQTQDARKTQNQRVRDWIKQTGPKMLLLGGSNLSIKGGGMAARPGYESKQWVMLNLYYPKESIKDDEPSLIADFNDPNFAQEITEPFKGCFSKIIFDWSVVCFVNDHRKFIPLITKMLTYDGQLFYGDFQDGFWQEARKKFLQTLFEEVRMEHNFIYNESIRPKHHKSAEKEDVVYVCSNPIQAE